jgi:hypothetical protein
MHRRAASFRCEWESASHAHASPRGIAAAAGFGGTAAMWGRDFVRREALGEPRSVVDLPALLRWVPEGVTARRRADVVIARAPDERFVGEWRALVRTPPRAFAGSPRTCEPGACEPPGRATDPATPRVVQRIARPSAIHVVSKLHSVAEHRNGEWQYRAAGTSRHMGERAPARLAPRPVQLRKCGSPSIGSPQACSVRCLAITARFPLSQARSASPGAGLTHIRDVCRPLRSCR